MILAKEKKIVQMKYIDWDHIESMNTPDFKRVIDTMTTAWAEGHHGFPI